MTSDLTFEESSSQIFSQFCGYNDSVFSLDDVRDFLLRDSWTSGGQEYLTEQEYEFMESDFVGGVDLPDDVKPFWRLQAFLANNKVTLGWTGYNPSYTKTR
jgi:hypothetical protein